MKNTNHNNFSCRSCDSTQLSSILDLGLHPWCNDFLKKEMVGKEESYPLHLVHCEKCELLQLNFTVPKETMFEDHTYVSSTTNTLKKHFYELAEENKNQFNLTDDDLIVDIGGNDGTQLLQYIKAGMNNVLNVESASKIGQLAIDDGVPTLLEFFNEETVKTRIGDGSIKLINASGVFFHLEELHSVIKGIKRGLSKDGIFVVQFMYAGTMIEKLNFDTIYHEHLCYYTLKSLTNLLAPYGLEIFDAYYSDIHSGSIIAKIKHVGGKYEKTERYITTLKNDEKYTKEEFLNFSKSIESTRFKLKNLLSDLRLENPSLKIYAYGAPAKGNTLLNYFDINKSLIDKCVEVNDLKIGRFLPKSHIPIVKESLDDLPDYYLLLSHNFAKEILERNRDLINKGIKFIVPFPTVQIVDDNNIDNFKF
tara:strand:- start:4026 stop:5288 length:1263 start_codon:yes stop_codon:yes gene_type:complete